MAGNENAGKPAQPGEQQGKFGIQKVYVKDISFESPNSPQAFGDQQSPSVNLQLTNESKLIADSTYEVVLRLTVTVATEEKTYYLAEVNQAGIFHIAGFADQVVARMVATVCPNILFPFAREMLADLVMRGGFPQLLLAPVNFEALYTQQQKQQPHAASDSNPQTTH